MKIHSRTLQDKIKCRAGQIQDNAGQGSMITMFSLVDVVLIVLEVQDKRRVLGNRQLL